MFMILFEGILPFLLKALSVREGVLKKNSNKQFSQKHQVFNFEGNCLISLIQINVYNNNDNI